MWFPNASQLHPSECAILHSSNLPEQSATQDPLCPSYQGCQRGLKSLLSWKKSQEELEASLSASILCNILLLFLLSLWGVTA